MDYMSETYFSFYHNREKFTKKNLIRTIVSEWNFGFEPTRVYPSLTDCCAYCLSKERSFNDCL